MNARCFWLHSHKKGKRSLSPTVLNSIKLHCNLVDKVEEVVQQDTKIDSRILSH